MLRKSIIHVEGPDVVLEDAPRVTTITKQPQPTAGAAEAGDQAPAGGKETAEQKKKKATKKMIISFEKYQSTASLLVSYLRKKEETGMQPPCFIQKLADGYICSPGMRQIDLMQQYLDEMSAEIQNEADLIRETTTLRSLITRLITKDHILIVIEVRVPLTGGAVLLTMTQAAQNPDQQILGVNPNYDLDDPSQFKKVS